MEYKVELDRAGPALPLIRQNLVKFSPLPFQIEPRKRGLVLKSTGGAFGVEETGNGDGGGGAESACSFFGGDLVFISGLVAVGQTLVFVSARISRPYVVRHLFARGATLGASFDKFRIKIAEDDSTVGGFDTSGASLELLSSLGRTGFITSGIYQSFPNRIVSSAPTFIKAVVAHPAAGSVEFEVAVSIEYTA